MRTCLFVVSFLLLNIAAYGQAFLVKQDSVAAVLKKFMKSRLRYPAVAAENEISGTIVLAFTVNDKQQINNVLVSKGIFAECDSAAVSALSAYNRPLVLPPAQYAIAIDFAIYNAKGLKKVVKPNLQINSSTYHNFLFTVENRYYQSRFRTDWIVDRSEMMPLFNNFKGKIKQAEISIESITNVIDGVTLDKWKMRFDYVIPGVLKNQKAGEYTFDSVNKLAFLPYNDSLVTTSVVYNVDKAAGLKFDIAQLKTDSFNKVQTRNTYDAQGRKTRENVFKDGKLHYYKYWKYNAKGLCTELGMIAAEDGLIFKDNYKYDQHDWLTEKLTDQTPKWSGAKTVYTYSNIDRKGNWRKLKIKAVNNWHETNVTRKMSYFDR